MSQRIWDRFLTEQDRAHLALVGPSSRIGFGDRSAVLSIDNYRWAVGDEPMPLLESVRLWPSSTGLAGWQALDGIQRLLGEARQASIPVVHVTGGDTGVVPWHTPSRHLGDDPAMADRKRRRHEIVPQAAPEPGEVVLEKDGPSAFFGTPLAAHLVGLGIDTLIVCGESTSGCVRASVVDARSLRFRVIVVEDCVYDRHEAAHAINLFDMDRKYADVLALEEVVTWMRATVI